MSASDLTTHEQILATAEQLFSRRGYAGVTLRDIATAHKMRHASLYYYFPDGKDQLYLQVMERNFQRHQEGVRAALLSAGDDPRRQLQAVILWFIEQPPLDLTRVFHADTLHSPNAQRLLALAFDSMLAPIVDALERARLAGQVQLLDAELAALMLINLAQGVHALPGLLLTSEDERQRMGAQMLEMLWQGLRRE